MDKQELIAELDRAVVDALEKWKGIHESICHDLDNPCPLCNLYEDQCSFMVDRIKKYCPLYDKKHFKSDNCCKEWNDVDRAISKMISRLDKINVNKP